MAKRSPTFCPKAPLAREPAPTPHRRHHHHKVCEKDGAYIYKYVYVVHGARHTLTYYTYLLLSSLSLFFAVCIKKKKKREARVRRERERETGNTDKQQQLQKLLYINVIMIIRPNYKIIKVKKKPIIHFVIIPHTHRYSLSLS